MLRITKYVDNILLQICTTQHQSSIQQIREVNETKSQAYLLVRSYCAIWTQHSHTDRTSISTLFSLEYITHGERKANELEFTGWEKEKLQLQQQASYITQASNIEPIRFTYIKWQECLNLQSPPVWGKSQTRSKT